jgi:uncharacterized integral membrane protein
LKIVLWILAAIVTLAVTSFAVTNRAPVEVDFWPLPFAATLPLFAILIVAAVLGFGFGAIATWWSGRKWRRRARDRGREIDRLQREIEALKRAVPPGETGRSHLPQTSLGADGDTTPTIRPLAG